MEGVDIGTDSNMSYGWVMGTGMGMRVLTCYLPPNKSRSFRHGIVFTTCSNRNTFCFSSNNIFGPITFARE